MTPGGDLASGRFALLVNESAAWPGYDVLHLKCEAFDYLSLLGRLPLIGKPDAEDFMRIADD